MGPRLVLLEASAVFVAVCATALAWMEPQTFQWAYLGAAAQQALAVCACSVVAFYYTDLYDARTPMAFATFARRLPLALGLCLVLLGGFHAVLPESFGVRGSFFVSLLAAVGLLVPLRAAAYRVIQTRPFPERILFLGSGPLVGMLAAEIESRPQLRLVVAGYVGDGLTHPRLRRPCLGGLDDLERIVDAVRPHRIVIAMPVRRGRLPVQKLLGLRASGIVVEDDVELYERLSGKLAIELLTPSQLIYSRDFHGSSPLHAFVSRSLSLAVAAVGLLVFAPLMALIAAAIRLESDGPVLFVKERVGLAGRRFRLLKFRTMRPAEASTSEWVRDNGERITGVGYWLRKFRLDELPQFVNVLRGEMNLVGPRPHPYSNYDLFLERIPFYAVRAAVRPGITGWAQVNYGYANDLAEETEKMRYDLYYIKHMSPWLDLKILFETVKIVVLGRGSSAITACGETPLVVR